MPAGQPTHGAPMPNHRGPCFCSQMAGGFDQSLSVVLPMLHVPTVTVEPTVRFAPSFPLPSSRSWSVAPQTPPPIVA
jgi:hypothetical protein